jgi:antitoxin (DNA-binding transcriptional repressor) of toxin-antitoxin stability system
MASRAAKSKPNRELRDVKALLSDLTERVLGGEGVEVLEAGRAAVANQLINTRLRAIELERKAKETEELEARIEELERGTEDNTEGWGGKKWGA